MRLVLPAPQLPNTPRVSGVPVLRIEQDVGQGLHVGLKVQGVPAGRQVGQDGRVSLFCGHGAAPPGRRVAPPERSPESLPGRLLAQAGPVLFGRPDLRVRL